jgi:hypothetical protein
LFISQKNLIISISWMYQGIVDNSTGFLTQRGVVSYEEITNTFTKTFLPWLFT